MLNFRIEGYGEAVKLIQQLPDNMQRNVIVAALRKSARPIVKDARANVPKKTGTLANNIRAIKAWKGIPKDMAAIDIKIIFSKNKRKDTFNGFYGLMIHDGTVDPRTSRKKGLSPTQIERITNRRVGSARMGKRKMMKFIGRDGKEVFTPQVKGLKPNPFLEKAYNANEGRVINEFAKHLSESTEKFVNKNFVKK